MKKVFCLCTESECGWFLVGKEYPVIDGKVLVEPGYECYPFNNGDITDLATFQIIQREVFEAHGFEWFKHTPGRPVPNAERRNICVLWSDDDITCDAYIDNPHSWVRHEDISGIPNIIGWRYEEEQKRPEQETSSAITFPAPTANWGEVTAVGVPGYGIVPLDKPVTISLDSGESIQVQQCQYNHMIEMPDHGHLTPAQKRHWDTKEKEFHESNVMEHAKRQQEDDRRAGVLQEAAEAMDKVGQDFSHKLGWK